MIRWEVSIKTLTKLNKTFTCWKQKNEKLKSFDLGYFIWKNHFDEDGSQNYLVFQPILRYFTLNINWITEWKSNGSCLKLFLKWIIL